MSRLREELRSISNQDRQTSAPDSLRPIDKADGHTLSIVPVSFEIGEEAAISFDPTAGKLYAATNLPGSNGVYDLFTINPTTGQAMIAAPIGIEAHALCPFAAVHERPSLDSNDVSAHLTLEFAVAGRGCPEMY